MRKPATRILCVWEQGSNLGHLNHLRLPIEVALGQGHQVFLAARELHRVGDVLAGLPVTLLQAPFKQRVEAADQASFLSYTHLIGRHCFSDSTELEMYLRAWRALFDLVRPGMVLFEHSPTALVAALSCTFKKVLVGGGFTVPAVSTLTSQPFLPFPTTPRSPEVLAGLLADDARLLAVINTALGRIGAGALPHLGRIFAQADARFLGTWPILDHFGERADERYLGGAPMDNKVAPCWPVSDGPRVFGYLQYFPAIELLLQGLQAAGVCALLWVNGLPPALKQAYTGPTMRFAEQLVDLRLVAEQAAWVVHHGNHSTMATFMLAGLPQLVIPRHQEQLFCALRLVAAGCAAMAFQDQGGYGAAILALQTNSGMKQSAKALASQCAPFDRSAVSEWMGQTFDRLL